MIKLNDGPDLSLELVRTAAVWRFIRNPEPISSRFWPIMGAILTAEDYNPRSVINEYET